jgi:hypothetical protein
VRSCMGSCILCKWENARRVVELRLTFPSLSTFPVVYGNTYNLPPGPATLHYIALGIGFVIGLQICAPISDRVSDFRFPISCLAVTQKAKPTFVVKDLQTP